MFPKITDKSQTGSLYNSLRWRRHVMRNSRVYTVCFPYLANAWHTLLFREIHQRGEQPHDETAGQIRPDGAQPEPPLHTNGCQTRSPIGPKPSSFSCAEMVSDATRMVNTWVRKCCWASPELSGLIRRLASTNVFGGRPALGDWVLMTVNRKVIYRRM